MWRTNGASRVLSLYHESTRGTPRGIPSPVSNPESSSERALARGHAVGALVLSGPGDRVCGLCGSSNFSYDVRGRSTAARLYAGGHVRTGDRIFSPSSGAPG